MRIKICAVGPIADKEMFNTIEELIEDVHQGKMVILLDDEDRENEGDFVMAAECVTPEAINFMARHGRGLVCMPMTESRCKTLNIGLMSPGNNGSQFGTNFTVSIEAAEGVTTGISAADRARTIQAAVAQNAVASDVVQPGHIFPIIAQKGGVLNRAGHTEASCDLARLAGFEPAAAIVEILNDDGSMARRDDLVEIAKEHDVKIGTIADLIRYRIQNEKSVEQISSMPLQTQYGTFMLYSYLDNIDNQIHFALVKGNISELEDTYIRVHYKDDMSDLFAIKQLEKSWQMGRALSYIEEKGQGVVVVLSNAESSESIQRRLEALESGNIETPETHLKTIGAGARILQDLGVKRMRVLSSPKRMTALSGFGLEVIEYIDG
jgi:3,4-dihydroxy 2-butanone 4-phosphate synthase / GTP cyclohydrolase II